MIAQKRMHCRDVGLRLMEAQMVLAPLQANEYRARDNDLQLYTMLMRLAR